MDIKRSNFEHNNHGHSFTYVHIMNDYHLLNHVDYYNVITINDDEYPAVYQTGVSYIGNDYSRPRNEPELSADGGTHPVLIKINSLYEKDFEDDEYINNFIAELADHNIQTKSDLWNIYKELNDNNCLAQQEFINDYNDFDRETALKEYLAEIEEIDRIERMAYLAAHGDAK